MRCENLDQVRENIDRLDREIVPLLAERSRYVDQAAGFKQSKAAVVDNDRIEAIILKVRHLAIEEDMDPELIENIYRSMIAAYIIHETHRWKKLHEGE